MAVLLFCSRTAVISLNISFIVLLSFFLAVHLNSTIHARSLQPIKQDGCKGLHEAKDHNSKCYYIQTHSHPCIPQGYIDYLKIFYCTCGGYPIVGYTVLFLWLLLLFYLLGNTASQYFCLSLESLSRLLQLPPTIAGVTLLSLGNGAPDVFASVVSFADSGVVDVGLGSVLGGVFFVSTIVVGIISLFVSSLGIVIHTGSFFRNISFLLMTLLFLLVILIRGRIELWGSIAFFSLYVVYVLIVWTSHCCEEKHPELSEPLLENLVVEVPVSLEKQIEDSGKELNLMSRSKLSQYFNWLIYMVELPLYLPRRLTIPDICEHRWSKPYAVASVSLAPLLLSAIWVSQSEGMSSRERLTIYLFGVLVGAVFGIVAFETTNKDSPPTKCLFPWLAGGFLMSVIWSYMTARELVALLVSIGHIVGISPLVLGLTVLAWGNSLGDLMANVAMATSGGGDGVQIAISGCYAGPIFNVLVGLGLSLVLAAGAAHPAPLVIPQDPSLFETLGFVIAGLIWAVVVLPWRGMKPDRVLGIGLLVIYVCFLLLRMSECLNLDQLLVHL